MNGWFEAPVVITGLNIRHHVFVFLFASNADKNQLILISVCGRSLQDVN